MTTKQDGFSDLIISDRDVTMVNPRSDGSVEREIEVKAVGTFIATITFADGTTRKCTVEMHATDSLLQNTIQRPLRGFRTDVSGLAMTGVWEVTSFPDAFALQNVDVPPDFVAVGGGAEGTETPQGTLLTRSFSPNTVANQTWSGGARTAPDFFSGPQISPVITWAIGLKIEGVPPAALRQIVFLPAQQSSLFADQSQPSVTLTLSNPTSYPQTAATPQGGFAQQTAISGGVFAFESLSPTLPVSQFVTSSAPLFTTVSYTNGTSERVVTRWVASSKDHVFVTPGFVRAQMVTLPKVLTINGSTFHVETWVSAIGSIPMAHPGATVTLPGDYALTGVGASVYWQTSPSAAGNMLWRLKPRADINGVQADSKDQWFSSPASITTYAIGIKLVPGPVPPWLLTPISLR